MSRLAIVTSHPIQYNAPWFAYLAKSFDYSVRVFYLWDFGVTEKEDKGFGRTFKWDVPLLAGYDYEFIANQSRLPGTHHFNGLVNPTLARQVQSYQPAAVLLMGYNYRAYYRFLWDWRKLRTPLLFRGDSHRLVPRRGIKEKLRRQWVSFLYRRWQAFLYVGQANYRYFQYHGVPASRLFRAPHSVDNQRFMLARTNARVEAQSWRNKLGIKPEQKVVLFAGKFEEKKRPLDLLRAFLQARVPDTVLLFVGNGPLEEDLRRSAAGHKQVFFAPFQNQTLMPRTYLAGDLFVLPSYGPSETWGLAINEAMCLARPVVVSTHVGCHEDLVKPEQNGLVFPAGEVAALTTCLQRALSEPDRLLTWGAQSRNIIENFSYRQTTAGLRQALENIRAMA